MHGQGLGSRGARRRRRRARGFPAIRETRVRRSSRCARYHPPSPTYTRLRPKGTARRCSFPGRTARHRAVVASSRRGLEARPVRPAAARDRRRPALPDVGMSFDRATDSGIALFLPGRNVPQSRLVRVPGGQIWLAVHVHRSFGSHRARWRGYSLVHMLPTGCVTDTRIKPTLGHQPSPSPSTKVKNGSICPSNCPVPQFSSRRPLDLSAVAAGFPSSSRRLASCRVLSTHAVHNHIPPAIAYTYIQRAAAGKENLPIKTPRAPGGGVRDPRGPAPSSRPSTLVYGSARSPGAKRRHIISGGLAANAGRATQDAPPSDCAPVCVMRPAH